jgi:hypothetical protein
MNGGLSFQLHAVAMVKATIITSVLKMLDGEHEGDDEYTTEATR